VLETVDFMSLDGAKAPSPKSGEEVINKFQGACLDANYASFTPLPPNMHLKDQILLHMSSTGKDVSLSDLVEWTESTNKIYYKKILKALHKDKDIHFNESQEKVSLLPSGSNKVASIVEKHGNT
ncbi:MAG: hypothetical protein AB2810_22535, partial [Candidatus Thiodiazotropha endolucinida]